MARVIRFTLLRMFSYILHGDVRNGNWLTFVPGWGKMYAQERREVSRL
jgi:hypothetical protein